MKRQEKEIENIKIAVIDSGIDPRFSVFFPNKKSKGRDWKNIYLRDTKNKKITLRTGHKGHDHKNSKTLDIKGHGTKCASVAAATKTEIKLHGTFPVSIEGAAPSAELYIYKVSSEKGSESQAIVKAFEAAIEDKVDVISISIGKSFSGPYHEDPIALGSFCAMESNILTVAACGNSGPSCRKISNVAPWILTVGASESKKKFKATVEIGREKFEGSSLNPSDIKRPLCIFHPELKSSINLRKRERVENFLKGYIVLCSNSKEMDLAKMAGAEGILYQDCTHTPYAKDDENFPSVWLANEDFVKICQLICNNPNPGTSIEAKICRSRMVDNPDPLVAEFSSRGPNPITNEILKPDICAPGVEICVPSVNPIKNDAYTIVSGTSFACPYVAGKAALLKREFEKNSSDSPSSIKSALMTTASNPGKKGSIFAKGAGIIDFDKAMNPGLVYNCKAVDYFRFFLDKERNKRKPWELNYPSITVKAPKDSPRYFWEIPRRLTYVGTTSETYEARITDQSHTVGIEIRIEPSTLRFTGKNCEQKFKVILNINKEYWTKTTESYNASLEWSPRTNKHQCVKSPIVIIREESS